MLPAIQQYAESQRQRFENDLCDWLKIGSVSTDPAFAGEVRKAADWLAERMAGLGLNPQLIQTARHPVIVAETKPVPGAPTVLVYGHYDVQPPDPLEEWTTPPFEPTIRNGQVYARGATDDKGQVITHLFAVESWLRSGQPLPVQVKFLIEGEEECGSHSLYALLGGSNPEAPGIVQQLANDIVVVSDSSQYGPGKPAITYGLRGIAYFELRLTGPAQDLHSGSFGGAISNPVNAICKMLGSLTDSHGRIAIPGFYDDVVPLTPDERQQFAALEFDDAAFMRSAGVEAMWGETGYSTLERRWARPTCDVNGIWGGYQGEGNKTVLPGRAGAKFSFRLVANQDPARIRAALESHLRQHCPPGIRMELIGTHGAPGSLVPLDSPFMAAAARAITAGFGREPVLIRSGGSIPIVNEFTRRFGSDTLLLGWGQDDDNMHGPNEKFSLADFHRGIAASIHLWDEIGKLRG